MVLISVCSILLPIITLFHLFQFAAVTPYVGEVDGQVGGHQQRVENIETDYNVVAVQRLVDNAENVAQND